MPPKSDVWSHYDKADEKYQDDTGEAKSRVMCTCRFCYKCFVFRNAEQLQLHLACPEEGVGKQSGCTKVRAISLAIRRKYATALSDLKAEKEKKSGEEARRQLSATSVGGGSCVLSVSGKSSKVAVAICVCLLGGVTPSSGGIPPSAL